MNNKLLNNRLRDQFINHYTDLYTDNFSQKVTLNNKVESKS